MRTRRVFLPRCPVLSRTGLPPPVTTLSGIPMTLRTPHSAAYFVSTIVQCHVVDLALYATINLLTLSLLSQQASFLQTRVRRWLQPPQEMPAAHLCWAPVCWMEVLEIPLCPVLCRMLRFVYRKSLFKLYNHLATAHPQCTLDKQSP